MKTSAPEYYRPTDKEFETLWKKCIFVLDTNVLLTLYRLPDRAREDVFTVLEQIAKRIWIPFQVDQEFEGRRIDVIDKEYRALEGHKQAISESFGKVNQRLLLLEFEKRNIPIDTGEFLKQHDLLVQQQIAAIDKALEHQIGINSDDPIRDRLNKIIEDRVGPAPESQDEVDKICAEGKERYLRAIPPGFADVEKAEDSTATYTYKGLQYQRQFGDLILWKQLIKHAASAKLEYLVLVTGDRKKDWWLKRNDQIVAPHPELLSEIRRCAPGMRLFYVYTLDSFLRYAKVQLASNVQDTSIQEVKDLAQQRQGVSNVAPAIESGRREPAEGSPPEGVSLSESVGLTSQRFEETRKTIVDWIKSQNKDGVLVENKTGFPDVLVTTTGGNGEPHAHGYEIKLLRGFNGLVFPPQVTQSLLRGYFEVHEGRLGQFTLILAANANDANTDGFGNVPIEDVKRRLDIIARRYQAGAIVFGIFIPGDKEFLYVFTSSSKRQTP